MGPGRPRPHHRLNPNRRGNERHAVRHLRAGLRRLQRHRQRLFHNEQRISVMVIPPGKTALTRGYLRSGAVRDGGRRAPQVESLQPYEDPWRQARDQWRQRGHQPLGRCLGRTISLEIDVMIDLEIPRARSARAGLDARALPLPIAASSLCCGRRTRPQATTRYRCTRNAVQWLSRFSGNPDTGPVR